MWRKRHTIFHGIVRQVLTVRQLPWKGGTCLTVCWHMLPSPGMKGCRRSNSASRWGHERCQGIIVGWKAGRKVLSGRAKGRSRGRWRGWPQERSIGPGRGAGGGEGGAPNALRVAPTLRLLPRLVGQRSRYRQPGASRGVLARGVLDGTPHKDEPPAPDAPVLLLRRLPWTYGSDC